MFTELLNQSCEIQEKTETQDAFGDVSFQWTTVSTPICRITTAPNSRKKEDGNYITNTRQYILFLDKSVSVNKGNRVLQNNNKYEIVDVQDFESTLEIHHKEAYLIKTDNN